MATLQDLNNVKMELELVKADLPRGKKDNSSFTG